LLVPQNGAAINQSRLWLALECLDLGVNRARPPSVVVVEKTQILATARDQSNISCAGNAAVLFDPNIVDT
jgi:hypothetical protein